MFRSFRLAWISSIRQPARTGLGILGIAAVGALLFDMLLLSRGLVISFRDLLERANFDVRVFATDSPVAGPQIPGAPAITAAVSGLPEVEAVVPVTFRQAELITPSRAVKEEVRVDLLGIDPRAEPLW